MIAEVADELHLRCSKLPPPYWTKVYINETSNGTVPILELPNGYETGRKKGVKGERDVRHRKEKT